MPPAFRFVIPAKAGIQNLAARRALPVDCSAVSYEARPARPAALPAGKNSAIVRPAAP